MNVIAAAGHGVPGKSLCQQELFTDGVGVRAVVLVLLLVAVRAGLVLEDVVIAIVRTSDVHVPVEVLDGGSFVKMDVLTSVDKAHLVGVVFVVAVERQVAIEAGGFLAVFLATGSTVHRNVWVRYHRHDLWTV